jgi:hypothetical protein
MRAFAAELSNAGYSVVQVDRMPVDAVAGLTLGSVKITPDEKSNPFKAEAGGTVGYVAELWRNGKVFASLVYSTRCTIRSGKVGEALQPGTVQFFLDHAVREAIALMEQR